MGMGDDGPQSDHTPPPPTLFPDDPQVYHVSSGRAVAQNSWWTILGALRQVKAVQFWG